MEVTSMSSLRSMVRPSLSQPKPAWANPAVFSAGVGSLKMKRNRLVVVGKTPSKKWKPDWQESNVPRSSSSRKFDLNGNPEFVIFVRSDDWKSLFRKEWFPLAMVEGSSTAKQIILAEKSPKDTIVRELASVIYKDENKIEEKAKLKLNNATKFRYGFKLVDNGNMKAPAEIINKFIKLPSKKKVKNVISEDTSGAKEPFGKLTYLN